MWLLYQVAFALSLAAAGPFLLARRGRHYLPTILPRLGAGGGGPPGALWIHAVSVGEVGVAATLVGSLPPETPLVVTTVTPTGQERAQSLLGHRAAVAYLPFDLGFAVSRFFRRFAPRALVLVEGDLWPLVLREAKGRGLPVQVINGRVSDRSFRRLARLRPLLGPLLTRVDFFGVQTAEDRRRLMELGVPAERVAATGNLKFETPAPAPRPDLEARLQGLAAGRPILVAGSTMAGEEERVLAAFQRFGGGERALLLLAPRHPERWGAVAELVRRRGLEAVRRTALPECARPAVALLDSLGELAALYRIATAAFIGGTLVPTGGHNPIEAARWGVPIAAGPSMENFREIAEQFDRAEAWRRVADAEELGDAWRLWLDDPEAARGQGVKALRLVESNRGALAHTLETLAPLLARFAGAEQAPKGRVSDP